MDFKKNVVVNGNGADNSAENNNIMEDLKMSKNLSNVNVLSDKALEEVETCVICGKAHEKEDLYYVYYKGEYQNICEYCMYVNVPEGYMYCNSCQADDGCLKPVEEMHTVYGGDIAYCGDDGEDAVCDEYLLDVAGICDCCGGYYYDDKITNIDDKNLCPECYEEYLESKEYEEE